MDIHLYPAFTDVFANNLLLGIFYPLCTISNFSNEIRAPLHFVSSNGLWSNDAFKTDQNSAFYTQFSLRQGKYQFDGDLRLYSGYEAAIQIYPLLEEDFKINGERYLRDKTQTTDYAKNIKKTLPKLDFSSFDLDYYLQAFYEFSINKLIYKTHKLFGGFFHFIEGRRKNERQVIIHPARSFGIKTINDLLEPHLSAKFEQYEVIGGAIGSDFFTDGNDSILLYSAEEQKVLSVNFYS